MAVLAAVLVASGAPEMLAGRAIAWQRQAQDALAVALRALRSGQPGAVWGFLALCFAHGFLHAVGPGHGKAVMAAYGAASGASLRWLALVAALSSLSQAAVAVLAVYAGVWLLGGARDRVEGLAALIEPASFAVIGLLGLMLVWRAVRRLGRQRGGHHHDHHHGHHHDHDHAHDETCGHTHGPDPAAVLAAHSWREAAVLILGVALRPCTSALFLLILTWRLDLDAIGIAGAFVMGLGTMMVTLFAALSSALMRRGVVLALPQGRGLAQALTLFELAVGAGVALLAALALLSMR